VLRDGSALGVITARGGSKSIPGKNLRDLGGRPLLAWTIEAALDSKRLDRVILSSDSEDIMSAARTLGCEVPFARPSELASDEAASIDVIHHALHALEQDYRYVALLQPTSPFVNSADIDACLELCSERGATSCVSVSEAPKHPHWMYQLDERQILRPILEAGSHRPTRRQDLPSVFVLNGAIFVARTEWILSQRDFISSDTVAHVMPSARAIDIDNEIDLLVAQALLDRNDDG